MRHLLASLLLASTLLPSMASAVPPRNPPPAADDPGAAWYYKTAADAKCPATDPVVSVDLSLMRYFPASDSASGRKAAFACTSVARSHGLTAPPAPPAQLAGSPVLFPISVTQGPEGLGEGSGGRMRTDVTIDANGLLTAQTMTHEETALHGFHGMVTVVLADENAAPTITAMLWKSDEQSFGVDGSAFGNPDRTDVWHATIPLDKLVRARRIGIVHRPSMALTGGGGGGILGSAGAVGGAFINIPLQRLPLRP